MKSRHTTHTGHHTSSELELEEAERELAHLLAPLARRTASPQLNARLRESMRVQQELQGTSALRRFCNRRIDIPLPVAIAILTLLAALAAGVVYMKIQLASMRAAAAATAATALVAPAMAQSAEPAVKVVLPPAQPTNQQTSPILVLDPPPSPATKSPHAPSQN